MLNKARTLDDVPLHGDINGIIEVLYDDQPELTNVDRLRKIAGIVLEGKG